MDELINSRLWWQMVGMWKKMGREMGKQKCSNLTFPMGFSKKENKSKL